MENAELSQKPPARRTVAFSVLHAYYPVVDTLHSYLENILHTPDDNNMILRETDKPQYRSLLTTSYVAGDATLKHEKRYVPSAPMMHMHDVSSRAFVFSSL